MPLPAFNFVTVLTFLFRTEVVVGAPDTIDREPYWMYRVAKDADPHCASD